MLQCPGHCKLVGGPALALRLAAALTLSVNLNLGSSDLCPAGRLIIPSRPGPGLVTRVVIMMQFGLPVKILVPGLQPEGLQAQLAAH